MIHVRERHILYIYVYVSLTMLSTGGNGMSPPEPVRAHQTTTEHDAKTLRTSVRGSPTTATATVTMSVSNYSSLRGSDGYDWPQTYSVSHSTSPPTNFSGHTTSYSADSVAHNTNSSADRVGHKTNPTTNSIGRNTSSETNSVGHNTKPPTDNVGHKTISSTNSFGYNNSMHQLLAMEGRCGKHTAEITNKWKVLVMNNTSLLNVGYLVAVFDQSTGRPLGSYRHVQPWSVAGALVELLRGLQDGRLVAVVMRPSITDYVVPEDTKAYLASLGSIWASQLGPRLAWHWIFIKGGPTLSEGMTLPCRPQVNVPSPHDFSFLAPLSSSKEYCPSWSSNGSWPIRRLLCATHEYYGELCRCEDPYRPPEGEQVWRCPYICVQDLPSSIAEAFVIVIASRPTRLWRSLRALLNAKGSSRHQMAVLMENGSREMILLLRVMGVSGISVTLKAEFEVTVISELYSHAVSYVQETMPEKKYIIFVEDDVQVSPDFFMYLNSTVPVLASDPTLYCVSAHNDISYIHTAYNTSTLLRTESYPNYGWIAHMSFLMELKALVESGAVEHDWDLAVYSVLRRERECIIPEVSRSLHFGSSGLHMTQYEYHLLEAWQAVNTDPAAKIQHQETLLMKSEKYEEYIKQLFSRAIFLDPTNGNFCATALPIFPATQRPNSVFSAPWVKAMLPRNISEADVNSDTVFVLFFQMENFTNRKASIYRLFSKCFRIHCCDCREPHRGLHRLRLGLAHLLLVAYPASQYSAYKPTLLPVLQPSDDLLKASNTLSNYFLLQTPYQHRPLQDTWRSAVLQQ